MKEARSFWELVPLEKLAEQQRVSTVDELDEIADLWPADDDSVDLLLYILAERAERRDLSENQRDRNKEI
jgi:hypothetical protein